MTLLDLVVLGLASHRLWMIWFYSKFTERLRTWMGERGGWAAYFAGCQFCTSVWAGFIAVGLWYAGAHLINYALAAGGMVFLIQPVVSLLEVTVQQRQVDIQRSRAEIHNITTGGRG